MRRSNSQRIYESARVSPHALASVATIHAALPPCVFELDMLPTPDRFTETNIQLGIRAVLPGNAKSCVVYIQGRRRNPSRHPRRGLPQLARVLPRGDPRQGQGLVFQQGSRLPGLLGSRTAGTQGSKQTKVADPGVVAGAGRRSGGGTTERVGRHGLQRRGSAARWRRRYQAEIE